MFQNQETSVSHVGNQYQDMRNIPQFASDLEIKRNSGLPRELPLRDIIP